MFSKNKKIFVRGHKRLIGLSIVQKYGQEPKISIKQGLRKTLDKLGMISNR